MTDREEGRLCVALLAEDARHDAVMQRQDAADLEAGAPVDRKSRFGVEEDVGEEEEHALERPVAARRRHLQHASQKANEWNLNEQLKYMYRYIKYVYNIR